MHLKLLCLSLAVALTGLLGSTVSAEVKRIAYPRVNVEVVEAYQPDAAFTAMRQAFVDATARKDANAVFALVAAGFVWAANGAVADDFDPGRDALHNFKVLFGFRQVGKDVDGGVEDGPFWAVLAAFAGEDTFYRTVEGSNLVCSPLAASIADEDVFQAARGKIETDADAADWYFGLRDTPVARAPNDKGTPIGRLVREAVPVLRTHPSAAEGEPEPTPTHFEVLLPSGRSGWVPAASVLPLDTSRLCYARAPGGAWKIGLYDAAE